MMYFLKEGKLQSFDAHKMPVFHETKKDDWVNWGWTDFSKTGNYEDTKWNNLQPNYYEWLYNSSSKHRTIINTKALFICGNGLKAKSKGLTLQEEIELKAFLFGINDSDFLKKLTESCLKIGGFCYEVIPSRNGKKIEPHFINIADVRRSKPEYDSQGREKQPIYYYTSNWKSKKPKENPDFTTFYEWDWSGNYDKNKRYLVYYSQDSEQLYPIPEYTAAVPYIAADYEVGNFVLNNTKHGFSGGYLVNFYNGEPEEDQKADIEAYFKGKFTGTDNAGEPLLSFNEDKDSGVELVPLNANGQDDRFINLNKQIREEIFSGHAVNPIVVGLEGNNGFNNNADEKRTEIEYFQLYYVTNKQNLLENHINAIRAYNGIKGEAYIQRLEPVKAQFSETMLEKIYTVDELREMDGAEPLTEEQKTTVIRETETQFKKEEFVDSELIRMFSFHGIDDDELEFINEREFTGLDTFQAEAQEQEFLSSLETLILKLLLGRPDMTVEEIAKVAKKPVDEVKKAYESLQEDGKIKDGEAQEEPPELFIVYKYALRPNAPSLKTESRQFCRNLMTLSKFKSWTLDDIRLMNNGQGLDVFLSRGGWYHNPDTGRNEPRCRHAWKQVLVRRKP